MSPVVVIPDYRAAEIGAVIERRRTCERLSGDPETTERQHAFG